MRKSKGFTLIELMIVVAIIGILAAIALPAFQNYTKRAKVTELITAASACRTAISEAYVTGGDPPAAGKWGCEVAASSKYVANITTDENGVILITAATGIDKNGADGKVLAIAPTKSDGTPVKASGDFGNAIGGWKCGATGTTIDQTFLPSSCKG